MNFYRSIFNKKTIPFLVLMIVFGCVEPFDVKFEDFDSALVVEATITNELKHQEIYITRTFRFEENGPLPERNVNVQVLGDDNTTYQFLESGEGLYVSENEFSAKPEVNYHLQLVTSDGRSYRSDDVAIKSTVGLSNIRAERRTNDSNEDGIAILVNSFDPLGNSLNYRYTYEETFKIIPPKWSSQDLIPDPDSECGLLVVPKEREERVCYRSEFSNQIIVGSTRDLEEDRVDDFEVRFITRDDYIISHRYSVLVKQYVQSNMAYSFYRTLNDFSSNENLFSETQLGFLEGNLRSVENENERVLGFFDVASVSEERLFFDYSDFYPGEPLPPFPIQCNEGAPPIFTMGGGCALLPIILAGNARYYQDNAEPMMGEGPYKIVPRVCGDCTVLGNNVAPDFWIE